MAEETLGGGLGQQVLQAVQQLGTQIEQLNTRTTKVEGWLERLGAEFIRSQSELKGEIQQVRSEMQQMGTDLRAEMQQMGTDIRAEMQQMGTDIRAEMQQMGTDIRAEMREGFQQVHGRVEATNSRIDRTNDVLILVGSEVYRTMGNVEELKQRVQALERRVA